MKLKAFVILMVLGLSTNVLAADGCPWKGEVISPGNSVYVKDPALVRMAKEHYIMEGYSNDAAKARAEVSDWVGFVLECVKIFSPGVLTGEPGHVLKPSGYELVLTDHQREFYADIASKHPR